MLRVGESGKTCEIPWLVVGCLSAETLPQSKRARSTRNETNPEYVVPFRLAPPNQFDTFGSLSLSLYRSLLLDPANAHLDSIPPTHSNNKDDEDCDHS